MQERRFNLSPAEALDTMRQELAKMKADPDRHQLDGMNPDDAMEQGYQAAIFDYESLTGPEHTPKESPNA